MLVRTKGITASEVRWCIYRTKLRDVIDIEDNVICFKTDIIAMSVTRLAFNVPTYKRTVI